MKLKFLDSDSTESVLSGVNKKFDVETNILFANISEIQERVLGIIIVQIIGAKNEIEGAQKYFSEHGVGYKEIYIKKMKRRKIWHLKNFLEYQMISC